MTFLVAPNNHLVRAYYRALSGTRRGMPWKQPERAQPERPLQLHASAG